MNKTILLLYILLLISGCSNMDKQADNESIERPNIVIIYMDDLGYGDVSSYGAEAFQTPNIDRISDDGMRFTNGYATSATCTPSRYALLTGQYPWKNEKAEILPGNAPLIFDTAMQTMPSILGENGYETAVIGKWHLGLGGNGLDWNGEITPGPRSIGFDYSFIMASTNDRVPTVYVENESVVGLTKSDPIEVNYPSSHTHGHNIWPDSDNFEGEPTGRDNPELLKLHPSHGHDMSINNGISRIGFMRGGKSALWTDEDMADTILNRALGFIEDNKARPFFLFYSLHQPHVPRTPHPRFVGKSGLGARGDAILEADWCIGQILDKLQTLGLEENTIVVFSSDNGPVLDDGYQDQANELNGDHTPTGELRGGKYSLFEAGARVPFIIKWPGKIAPSVSNELISQVDLLSTFASINQLDYQAMDSKDLSELLLSNGKGRESLIIEAMGKLAIRRNDWVLIPPYDGPKIINEWVKNETGLDDIVQLYNLTDDPRQQKNLAADNPDITSEMLDLLEKGIE